MHECLLCERDMKRSKNKFGKGCINNIYKFLDIEKPKRGKSKELLLYKNIMQRTHISKINKEQKIWLTDRYLTYQYLDNLPYGNFEKLKDQIDTDIKNINHKTEKEFYIPIGQESVAFENSDLYFAIHKAKIEMKAEKNEDGVWKVDVKLSDTFDFTKWKWPLDYYYDANSIPKSILSSTLYNLAFVSQKLGVIKEYEVIAKFSMNI